jgi:hypothetical protein
MSIHYDAVQLDPRSKNTRTSPILAKLTQINEAFQAQGLNALNEGFADIASNTAYYNDYINQLSEELTPECAEQFEILAENSRREILTESTISGVSPITALSLPLLRVAFPKTCVREGLPTEPVTQPKFTVNWLKPYVVDPSTGNKLYLPAAMRTGGADALFGLPQLTPAVALTSNMNIGYDLTTGISGASHYPNGDEIDPNFTITQVNLTMPNLGTGTTAVQVPVSFQLDTFTNVAEGTAVGVAGPVTSTVRVFAKVDRTNCTMDVIAAHISTVGADANETASITGIVIQGYLSSELNNRATQIGFDITPDPTVIGTGQPIESPINIQQMMDTMAMYNVDSTVRSLEIMSTTLAQHTDMTGVNFIANQFSKLPSGLRTTLTDTFDITPPSNYALGPTAWREEMKIRIDRLVIRLMDQTQYTSGSAVIFGHPENIQVLNNVRWSYSDGDAPNGVNIDYRLGTYASGITSYKVLSSFNFPKGSFYICYLPNVADQKTLVYYPYSFSVIRGSNSPNTPNLPSIQMIKRQIFREYTQMIAKMNLTES